MQITGFVKCKQCQTVCPSRPVQFSWYTLYIRNGQDFLAMQYSLTIMPLVILDSGGREHFMARTSKKEEKYTNAIMVNGWLWLMAMVRKSRNGHQLLVIVKVWQQHEHRETLNLANSGRNEDPKYFSSDPGPTLIRNE